MEKYFYARGRRKTAHARIKLVPGKGSILINNNSVTDTNDYQEVFSLVGQQDKWDTQSFVHGGGVESQKEAIKLALARALVVFNSDLKSTLRKAGFLTRDPREKERKKPGLKGARRAPQWSKR
jgi:small subunit ribosomal protein S9